MPIKRLFLLFFLFKQQEGWFTEGNNNRQDGPRRRLAQHCLLKAEN